MSIVLSVLVVAVTAATGRTVADLGALFATPTEGTHFSETGATQVANLVAQALKTVTSPVRSHLLK